MIDVHTMAKDCLALILVASTANSDMHVVHGLLFNPSHDVAPSRNKRRINLILIGPAVYFRQANCKANLRQQINLACHPVVLSYHVKSRPWR